ncbi:hypothetical protein [Meridianimarinicoccus aquatilis]|uniref:hypothetical protein n=1 Tax=Meridianimarinicoccus aquatilis TaxID=2552766 RepID=UPI0013DE83DF|nr:hypothetical protein [Fluviibacterium aquatile]QIE43579.1 hypothetical protein G5B39_17105 [Rhodobacteraceae bacterium SC52]
MQLTRRFVAVMALGLIGLVLVIDFAGGAVPNAYQAPAVVALGSGQVATGAMCAGLPGN